MQAAPLRQLLPTMAQVAVARVVWEQPRQTILAPREETDCRQSQLMALSTTFRMCLERPTQTWLFSMQPLRAGAVECGGVMAPYGTVQHQQRCLSSQEAPGEGCSCRQTDATCRSYMRLPTPAAEEVGVGQVTFPAAPAATGALGLC